MSCTIFTRVFVPGAAVYEEPDAGFAAVTLLGGDGHTVAQLVVERYWQVCKVLMEIYLVTYMPGVNL